jgi:hypothetical protein
VDQLAENNCSHFCYSQLIIRPAVLCQLIHG